jgi:hypothetical protein
VILAGRFPDRRPRRARVPDADLEAGATQPQDPELPPEVPQPRQGGVPELDDDPALPGPLPQDEPPNLE